ncbi:MAG: winged helix DNA-binding protein [Nitrososphaerota archaeon]|jgi:predicted transcriptional regulator|nr:winged helix DNA-binding protein [Nitrososphaerota archaeon]MDG6929667.1 winged helix DNA-binding protein [Nitrososphaerota archaeon]
MTNISLTEIKKQILEICNEPTRLVDISSKVNITQRNVIENLKALQKAGLIQKHEETGQYELTDKGREYLALAKRLEALESSMDITENTEFTEEDKPVLDETVKILRESKALLPIATNVKIKNVTSPWMQVPIISDILSHYGKNESIFYQFITAIYIRALRLYGPEGLRFKPEFFRYIRSKVLPDLINAKYKNGIPDNELENLRIQITIEFGLSDAFDEAVGEFELNPGQKELLLKSKHEIIKEIAKKLYNLKVVQAKSE